MGTHPIFESDFDCLTEKMSIRIIKTGLVAASRRGFAVNPIRYNLIQPSRSFFNKADDAAKAKAEQAANAEQSEQNEGEITIEQENESLKQQVEELLAKVEAKSKKETDLSYKLAELSDEYKRQGARFKRETEKTKVYAIKNFAKDLFPVADQFILALDHVEKMSEEDLNNSQESKDLANGVKMTQGELNKAFDKNKIKLIDPSVGDDFNHDLHEAVMQVPRANVPDLSPNQIAFIQKTGYVLEDQILRPCWVGVVAE